MSCSEPGPRRSRTYWIMTISTDTDRWQRHQRAEDALGCEQSDLDAGLELGDQQIGEIDVGDLVDVDGCGSQVREMNRYIETYTPMLLRALLRSAMSCAYA